MKIGQSESFDCYLPHPPSAPPPPFLFDDGDSVSYFLCKIFGIVCRGFCIRRSLESFGYMSLHLVRVQCGWLSFLAKICLSVAR